MRNRMTSGSGAPWRIALFVLVCSLGCSPGGPKDDARDGRTDSKPQVFKGWPFDATEAKRRQKKTAAALGLPVEQTVDLGGGVTMRLVLIPAGEFDMGSPKGEKGRRPDEGPVRRITLTKPFYMGKYEVTRQQWRKLMNEAYVKKFGGPISEKNPNNPVRHIEWGEAKDFTERLNRLALDAGTFRLPTEAEWEYACRAGTSTPFSFGSDVAQLATYAVRDIRVPYTVGTRKANPWGLHDMHGNASEWCWDYYADKYPKGAHANPRGPQKSAAWPDRVLRGGGRRNDRPWELGSARRIPHIGSNSAPDGGLRVIMIPFGRVWGTEESNVDNLVHALLAKGVHKRHVKVESFIQHRRRLIRRLITMAESDSDKDARAGAMYLLGKIRAVEAVDVLVRHISFNASPVAARGDVHPHFGTYVAYDALRAIGRPCTDQLLDEVARTELRPDEVKKADPIGPEGPRRAGWLLHKMYSREELGRLVTERLKKTKDKKKKERLRELIGYSDRREPASSQVK